MLDQTNALALPDGLAKRGRPEPPPSADTTLKTRRRATGNGPRRHPGQKVPYAAVTALQTARWDETAQAERARQQPGAHGACTSWQSGEV